MPDKTSFFRKYAFIAILILALAGTAGSLLRFALAYGIPPSWGQIPNIRHAHSHTMFGWTILALMALIWQRLPHFTGRSLPRGVKWQMAATAFFSLLQLLAFWPNGYGLTTIGTAQMPLGAMSAGFAGLTWFWFMGLYVKMTFGFKERPLAMRLWDWGLVLLLLASLGALSEPILMALHNQSVLIKTLFLHLFLDLFSSGWLLLGVLGALWSQISDTADPEGWLPVRSLALFILPTFVLGMPPDMITPALFWIAAFANVIAMALVAFHIWRFLKRWSALPMLVRFGLLGLFVQMGASLLMLIPAVRMWGVGTLRIFYLHTLLLVWTSSALLGLLTSALSGAKRFEAWRRWGVGLWIGDVGVMWLALLAGGFLQWLPVSGRALLALDAWASVPIVIGAWLLLMPLLPSSVQRRK